MSTPTRRHPLPALIFLLALCLLTALVWWRVINRDSAPSTPSAKCTSTAPSTRPNELPNPATVTVVVLNSTERAGIAATARTALLAAGFSIPEPAANDSAQYGGHDAPISETAEIRYGPAAESGAHLLAYFLPGAKLVAIQASGATGASGATQTTQTAPVSAATIIVSLGEKFDQVAATADALGRIAADKLTVAPAPTPAPPASSSGSAPPPSSTPPC